MLQIIDAALAGDSRWPLPTPGRIDAVRHSLLLTGTAFALRSNPGHPKSSHKLVALATKGPSQPCERL
jgi:hypothetical protein